VKSLLTLLPVIVILNGCGNAVPDCADKATIRIVEGIYWDLVSNEVNSVRKSSKYLQDHLSQNIETLKKTVSIELSTVEQEVKEKDRFSCKAQFTLKPSSENKELLSSVGKEGAYNPTLMIMLGAGKDDASLADSKDTELVKAAKMILGMRIVSDSAEKSNVLTAPLIQGFAGAATGATLGIYAASNIGTEGVQFLVGAVEDLSALKINNGNSTGVVQYVSFKKKIDGQDSHYVKAQFDEGKKQIMLPIALGVIGDKFNKGNERLSHVRQQLAQEKK
jgi:hypothetical protein